MKRAMDKYNKRLIEGFTLIEIMIVVVLIAVIAGFGIPTFDKMVRKSHERTTIMELISLHTANQVYEARGGLYLSGTNLNLSQINTGLSIMLKGVDTTYDYDYKAGNPGNYKASTIATVGNNYKMRLNEKAINLRGGVGRNPCCSSGTCLTLPNC